MSADVRTGLPQRKGNAVSALLEDQKGTVGTVTCSGVSELASETSGCTTRGRRYLPPSWPINVLLLYASIYCHGCCHLSRPHCHRYHHHNHRPHDRLLSNLFTASQPRRLTIIVSLSLPTSTLMYSYMCAYYILNQQYVPPCTHTTKDVRPVTLRCPPPCAPP